MPDSTRIIWSNADLDYEDWRDDLEAEYPDLTESQRVELMYERNADYLDDERINLNIQLSRPGHDSDAWTHRPSGRAWRQGRPLQISEGQGALVILG